MANTINRRAFLRTAASVSTIMAGTTAATIADAAEHPDAELLALGDNFDRMFPLVDTTWERARIAIDAFNASYPGRKYDLQGNYDEDYWGAYLASAASRLEDEADAISNEVMSLTASIRERPAATLAGLFVKARALKYDLCMPCDDPRPRDEWDLDEECLAVFIDEVERMAQMGRA